MNFIYAIILGVIFGLSEISIINAILLILLLIFIYSLKDVFIKKQFFTNTPSAYVLYIENLKKIGKSTKGAWLSYLLQSIFIDSLIAIVTFFVVHFLFRI